MLNFWLNGLHIVQSVNVCVCVWWVHAIWSEPNIKLTKLNSNEFNCCILHKRQKHLNELEFNLFDRLMLFKITKFLNSFQNFRFLYNLKPHDNTQPIIRPFHRSGDWNWFYLTDEEGKISAHACQPKCGVCKCHM